MTLQALPTQPTVWRPDAGYLAAACREQSDAHALSIIQEAADGYWGEEFWPQCDKLMLLEKPTPPPAQRLSWYQLKPVQEAPPVPPVPVQGPKGEVQLAPQPQPPRTGSWMGQKIDFPNDYQHDMEDWAKLEPVSLRRDQVWREIATLEMMAAGQQGMTQPPEALPQLPPTSGEPGPLPPIPWVPGGPTA
jgi:hypothetical protein